MTFDTGGLPTLLFRSCELFGNFHFKPHFT